MALSKPEPRPHSGAPSDPRSETVVYKDGEAELHGYFAYDASVPGKRPGVLLAHDWWGLGPYPRRRADMLAGLGFAVLALDMYGHARFAKTRDEAAKFANPFSTDRAFMRRRALAGLEVLGRQKIVEREKLAGIGYCFGGTTVLELARAGADLKGVVSFHGALDTPRPRDTKSVKAKILVLHGAEDVMVNPHVPAFHEEMRRAEADWQMVYYGGAYHGFSKPEAGGDPSGGIAYNEAADRRSWNAMKGFFAEIFA